MHVDMRTASSKDRYTILANTVLPRPIAWVTTISRSGVRNAAPFSFFNAMSDDPPLLALGILANGEGRLKDTSTNILETKEFVVNLVPAGLAEAMNATSVPAPPEIDELNLVRVETEPSVLIRPPRIKRSPVAFECRLHTDLQISPGRVIILGEVLMAHIADSALSDEAAREVDAGKLDLIARMHGRGWYAHTRDLFKLDRPIAP